jgi:preprotein translocase subunit SecB
MHAQKSPLILEETFIIASNILSVPSPEEFQGDLNDFSIDIDFDIFTNEDDAEARRIVVSVQGNDQENPVPGYCFSIVAQGTFNYGKSVKVNKKDKDVLITHSAIPMVIGQIRSYLSTLTAHGPFGIYLLPAIDMNDLIKQKFDTSGKDDQV